MIKFFKLKEHKTDIPTEVIAGCTTYLTLCYIIFVQPAVMSTTGMDFGAVMMATCISSALATFLMGLLANYPVALAPAMGHNFYFAFTVCGTAAMGGMGYTWQQALGAVFISGVIFILVSGLGFREQIIDAVPDTLKYAIAVGIGLLIAMVGLQWSGLVVDSPGTLVTLGDLKSPPVLISLAGFMTISILLVWDVRGAFLLGMAVSTILGLTFGLIRFQGVIALPPSIAPTLFKLKPLEIFSHTDFLSVIFVFFFLDLFDTIGTLIGVAEQGRLMVNGKLPRAKQALFSDAVGTTAGAVLGTSTVTSYIESATGIAAGGRTGLCSMVTGTLMLLSVFFYPLVKMIGEGVEVAGGGRLYPVIAPVLITLGGIMISSVVKIPWDKFSECIPAFLTIIIMPVTFSITEGIAFGFISYSILSLAAGEARRIPWILHLFAGLFLLRYLYLM
jgi:AGZA family xanthine/uracil permease-like MFS transporter